MNITTTLPRTGGHSAKNTPPVGSPNTTQQSSKEAPIMAHSHRADQTPGSIPDTAPDAAPGAMPNTAPGAPMPATLTTARALIRQLRTDLATTRQWLREATAYIDLIERERDDAFADADHWREQAAQTEPTMREVSA